MSLNLLSVEVGPWPMNVYVVVCTKTGSSAVIDPGANPQTILKLVKETEVEKILVTHSHPAAVLIDCAHQFGPDLIVLGAKGLRATLGILLGGIAQQVVEYADWPVLVVRVPYKTPQRIVLAIDGSECSKYAVEHLA